MTIHFLVEGLSELRLFEPWLARLLKKQPFRIHPHQGKGQLQLQDVDPRRRGLLDQLPQKLRGFATTLRTEDCDAVVVVVDADDDDCVALAESIRDASRQLAPNLNVIVRIAVEEVEAYYFGDLAAIQRAFPEANMKACRDFTPDQIVGTAERFAEAINSDVGNKTRWAMAMAPHLTVDPSKSRSPSFRALARSLRALDRCTPRPAKRRRFFHRVKRS